MCGLCGMFGIAAHWTDGPGAATAGAAGTATADRRHRAAIANRMLGVFGLSLREWAGRFTLSGPTGRGAVVDNLGAVWPVAEQVAGRACDPLDPSVIAAIEARNG